MRLATIIALFTNMAIAHGTGLEIEPGYNIDMWLLDEVTVQFKVVMKDNSWLGLHLGGVGMELGGDMIRFVAFGEASAVIDEYSTGF